MLTRDILRYIPQRIHCVQIPWLRSITVRLAGVLLSVLDNLVRSLSFGNIFSLSKTRPFELLSPLI